MCIDTRETEIINSLIHLFTDDRKLTPNINPCFSDLTFALCSIWKMFTQIRSVSPRTIQNA